MEARSSQQHAVIEHRDSSASGSHVRSEFHVEFEKTVEEVAYPVEVVAGEVLAPGRDNRVFRRPKRQPSAAALRQTASSVASGRSGNYARGGSVLDADTSSVFNSG